MNVALFKQLLRYGIVGVGALAVDVGTFALARKLGLDLVSSNLLARFAGAVAAFCGNHLWTFSKSKAPTDWVRTGSRYALAWAGASLLSTSLLLLVTHFGANELIGKALIEMGIPLLNFIIAKYWVFR